MQAIVPGPLPAGVHQLFQDDSILLAHWEDVYFTMMCSVPTLAQLQASVKACKTVHALHPKGVVNVAYIARTRFTQLNVPTEVRHAINRATAETDPLTRAGVQLFAGSGFFASMGRSVLAGINSVSRRPFPLAVVEHEEDAVAFLAKHVSPGFEPALRGTIDAYRVGLEAASAKPG